MARTVQVASGKSNVQLPDGLVGRDEGDEVVLTDEQFASIPGALFPTYLVDLGTVEDDTRVVAVSSGKSNVVLPGSNPTARADAALFVKPAVGDAGDTFRLTGAQYDQLTAGALATFIDEGNISDLEESATEGIRTYEFDIALADVVDGIIATFTPGVAGTIISVDYLVTKRSSTKAKNSLTLTGTTGTWKLTRSAVDTAALAFGITAANLKLAITAAWGIAAADFTVTGGDGGTGSVPFVITYLTGDQTDFPTITAANVSGNATPSAVTAAVNDGTTTLTQKINAVAVTNGSLAITNTTAAARGTLLRPATQPSATNVFDNNDTVSLVAASTTANPDGTTVRARITVSV